MPKGLQVYARAPFVCSFTEPTAGLRWLQGPLKITSRQKLSLATRKLSAVVSLYHQFYQEENLVVTLLGVTGEA